MQQMNAIDSTELVQAVDRRTDRKGARPNDQRDVLKKLRHALTPAEAYLVPGHVDVGHQGVQEEPHPCRFEVGAAAVGEVAPVAHLTGDVVRDAADREVRIGVGHDHGDLDQRIQLPHPQRGGDTRVTTADHHHMHIAP